MYNDNHEKNILKTADALANAHVFFADTLFLITRATLSAFSQVHFVFHTKPPDSLKNKKNLSFAFTQEPKRKNIFMVEITIQN